VKYTIPVYYERIDFVTVEADSESAARREVERMCDHDPERHPFNVHADTYNVGRPMESL
jgi:hypothetical protein